MQPANRGESRGENRGKEKPRPPRSAADDYKTKVEREISHLSRRMKHDGHPAPLGDPTSGIVLVVGQPVGPRVLQALERSLEAVGLPRAYVTYAATGLLAQEILATEPHALVAVGAAAAREIDALAYPLAQHPFSKARTGAWFAWTRGTRGLRLPALAPALGDEGAKRRFWRAFLALRDLAPQPARRA